METPCASSRLQSPSECWERAQALDVQFHDSSQQRVRAVSISGCAPAHSPPLPGSRASAVPNAPQHDRDHCTRHDLPVQIPPMDSMPRASCAHALQVMLLLAQAGWCIWQHDGVGSLEDNMQRLVRRRRRRRRCRVLSGVLHCLATQQAAEHVAHKTHGRGLLPQLAGPDNRQPAGRSSAGSVWHAKLT